MPSKVNFYKNTSINTLKFIHIKRLRENGLYVFEKFHVYNKQIYLKSKLKFVKNADIEFIKTPFLFFFICYNRG